ncbi:MAG: phage tail protein [Flavobacteriales bacterium]|nr:phage tail protein [Flavobacteriales bacterium]
MSNYPLPKFHFAVEWGGIKIGFTEVTGLNIETEIIEYRDGSSPEYSKTKMPGLRKYGNITLKRGVFAGDNEFYEWFNTVSLNKIERRNVTISLLNENHVPVVVWSVKNAFPVKLQAPDLKSDANEAAIESLEIAHEGLSILNLPG